MDIGQILLIASVWVLPVLIAVTLHEAAHGWVAWRLGDMTAKQAGRVTFNPLKHVDAMGTVIVPGFLIAVGSPFLFGWAKPVPVNFMRLRRPRRDMVLVAAAGPGINLLLAVAAALLMHLALVLPGVAAEWAWLNLRNAVLINVVLAVFNMIPLPPLDGGRVAVGLLPRNLAMPLARLERWGLFIIIGLLIVLPSLAAQTGLNINLFAWVILPPIEFLIGVIELLTGAPIGF